MPNRYWIATSTGNKSATANWSATSGGAGGASVPGAGDTAIFDRGAADCIVDTPWTVGAIQATDAFAGNLVVLKSIVCDSIEWAGNKLHLADSNIGELILPRSRAAGSTVNFDPWGGASYAPQNLTWISKEYSNRMTFRWDPVPNATSYSVYYYSDNLGYWADAANGLNITATQYSGNWSSSPYYKIGVLANTPQGQTPMSTLDFNRVDPDFVVPFVPLVPQPVEVDAIECTSGSSPLAVNIWANVTSTGDIDFSDTAGVTITKNANGKITLTGTQDQDIRVPQLALDYTLTKPAGVVSYLATSGTIRSTILRGGTDDPRDVTTLDLIIGTGSTIALAGDVAARSTTVSAVLNIASGTILDTYSITEQAGAAANNLGTIRVHTGNATLNGNGTRGTVVYWGTAIPAVPTSILAEAVTGSDTSIYAYWTASSGATSYELQRSLSQSSGFATVYTGPNLSFTDTGLTPGTTYYYRVRASNAAGTSDWTPATYAATTGTAPTPGPAVPTNLTATALSDSAIGLEWDVVQDATSYEIERSINGTTWEPVTEIFGAVTDAMIMTVAPTASVLTFTLPFGAGELSKIESIDWGDGSTALAMSHTYNDTTPRTIRVNIVPGSVFTAFTFYNKTGSAILKSVDACDIKCSAISLETFRECRGLVSVCNNVFAKCLQVTSFSNCFGSCSGLTAIPTGLFDKNTAATGFSNCFINCSSLAAIPTGLFDKNTAVTNFRDCFDNCSKVTTVASDAFGITPNSTRNVNFTQCFRNCSAITSSVPTLWTLFTAAGVTKTNCFTGVTQAANRSEIPTAWGGD